MNPRALFFRSGVGFDLRGQTIRSVQIAKTATGKLSIQYREMDWDDELAKATTFESMSKLSSVIAVPTADALVQRFEFPFQSKRALKELTTLELERRLPTDIADWHHALLSPAISDKKTAVQLIAAIPKHRLATVLSPLYYNGCYPTAGLHAGALITLLEHCAPNEKGFIAEVGENEATLIVKSSQRIEMVRGLRYGMHDMTLLAQELRRTITALPTAITEECAPKITVLGSAAEVPEFTNNISKETGLKAKVLSLRLKGHDEDLPASLVVSAGAALQAYKGDKNFIFPAEFSKDQAQRKIKTLRIPALALLAILMCWGISFGLDIQKKSRELEHLTQLQNQVFRRALPDAPKHLRPSQYMAVMRERIKRLTSSTHRMKTNSLASVDSLRIVHIATQDSKVLVRKIMLNNSTVTLTLQAEKTEQLRKVKNRLVEFPNVQDVVQKPDNSLSTQGAVVATTRFTVKAIGKGLLQ